MKRIEYTGAGGEYYFTNALLIGKDILSVKKDGIGCSKIITGVDPVKKQTRYYNAIGRMWFAFPFEAGEMGIVLYQDADNVCLGVTIEPGSGLPDASVGFPYAASFFVDGNLDISLSAITKPGWMEIDISGHTITFSGTPLITDEIVDTPVSFTAGNDCGSTDFSENINVVATGAVFDSMTFVSGDRFNDVEIANFRGMPGVVITIEMDEYSNDNGGDIRLGGAPVVLADTRTVTLDANGEGSIGVEIAGFSVFGTHMRGHFIITGVSFGTIGTNNTFQISKAF